MWHAPRISGTSEGSISIRRDDFGDVTVLTLSGKLSIGEASVLVREKIRELLKEGRLRFILNYSAVRYIDSSGLHALVTSLIATKNARGSLVLAGLNPSLDDAFELTRLNKVFEIFQSVPEALESFGVSEAGHGEKR